MKNLYNNITQKNLIFLCFTIILLLTMQNYGLIDDAEAQLPSSRLNSTNTNYHDSLMEMHGYFNIGEKIFEDGTFTYEYHLFVDDRKNNPPYFLNFNKVPDDVFDLSGKQVVIQGSTNHNANNQARFFANSDVINVNSIKLSNANENSKLQSNLNQFSENSSANQMRSVPSDLKTVVILSRFSDVITEPHTKSYFQGRVFTDSDSLKNYWADTSYGAITMSPGTLDGTGVVDWQSLTVTRSYFTTGGIFTGDDELEMLDAAIFFADPFIDFDGADNIIQNTGPQIGGPGNNGDDVDQVIMVFNQALLDGATPAAYAFAYLDPIDIYPDEGTMYVYPVWTPDLGDGFPVGINYGVGIGTVAHEMGHDFNWRHTPAPPPSTWAYDDPWSIMSAGPSGPAGAIAFNRDQAGWIPSGDINTVSDGTQENFTLDFLSDPSPGANYLMGKIPFGVDGEYYTLEARTDSTFDQTPQNQFGLMIYHYNPLGHTGSPEPSAPVNVVDTTGTGDWDNTDLDLGNFYSANGVLICHQSQTYRISITVFVDNNDSISVCPPSQYDILIPTGSGVSGCENTNECYLPFTHTIPIGTTVKWFNGDTTGHTATSGTPGGGLDGEFNSGVISSGNTFSHTFNTAGSFDYFDMTHPWMVGKVNVDVCIPPGSGSWTVTSSCTLTENTTITGNVLVQNNSVLTVPSGITLDINFSSFNLTVKSGSGVSIESGGKIT